MTPGDDSADKAVALKSPHEVIPLRNAARTYRISANRFLNCLLKRRLVCEIARWGFCFARGLVLGVRWGEPVTHQRENVTVWKRSGLLPKFQCELLFTSKSTAGIKQLQDSVHSVTNTIVHQSPKCHSQTLLYRYSFFQRLTIFMKFN